MKFLKDLHGVMFKRVHEGVCALGETYLYDCQKVISPDILYFYPNVYNAMVFYKTHFWSISSLDPERVPPGLMRTIITGYACGEFYYS